MTTAFLSVLGIIGPVLATSFDILLEACYFALLIFVVTSGVRKRFLDSRGWLFSVFIALTSVLVSAACSRSLRARRLATPEGFLVLRLGFSSYFVPLKKPFEPHLVSHFYLIAKVDGLSEVIIRFILIFTETHI